MERKDYKLFLSLVLWALVPSVYLLIRMNIVSINNVDINILGQMEWFDLIDEIIVTTLTVPLYYLLKPTKTDKYKNAFAFFVSFGIYAAFTVVISLFVGNIAEFMNAEYATRFLFLQSFSMLIAFISTFMIMLFTLNDDYKTVGVLLIARVVILSVSDYFFISKAADIGAAYSEIFVNSLIAIVSLVIAFKREYIVPGKCEKTWIKDWAKVGSFSGIQIFLDNFIYAVMICKMVNAVSESGNYWVANNFIWGWLLIPVTCMASIIKKNDLEKLTMKNTWRFGLIIIALWLISAPGWSWFIANAMASDASSILAIVWPNIPFYVTYIISAFIDAWFVSKGKTHYTMIISLIVNIVYYGILYILFNQGVFTLGMTFIILMFGGGMLVHMVVSCGLYWMERKRIRT